MRTRPALAIKQMRALDYAFAPVLDGKRLAGVLTVDAALTAEQEGQRDISRQVVELASMPDTAGLDEVLVQLVASDQPVAVTGDGDKFIGMLSRAKVMGLVTPGMGGVESR
ncbi:hypothetical protein [Rhodanobacter lindaniclasticus]